MLLAKIENKEVVEVVNMKQFGEQFPNVCLPNNITDDSIRHLGYRVVGNAAAPHGLSMTKDTIIVPSAEYDEETDKCIRIYSIQPYPYDSEKRAANKFLEKEKELNAKLAACDAKVMADANPVELALWTEYRTALKDAMNKEDPFTIEFPDEPSMNYVQEIEKNVQDYIATVVKSRGYDNENSIAKYLVDNNPFYEECKAISVWIGNVWIKTHEIQREVEAGIRPIPTINEVIAELPVLV